MASPAKPRSGGCAIRLAGITLALAVAGVALGAAGLPRAEAQQVAPSRVTPQTLQPAPQPAAPIALTAPAGLTPPKNAEHLSVRLDRFEVAGTFPGFEGTTAALFNPLRGKPVTVAWIYQTANALEHKYAEAGYILARVVIPPQKLVDGGTLHLTVIDGVIERVDVKGVPDRQRGVVIARVAALVGVRHLMLDEIERRLLLVSDIPGLQVRSTLTAGKTPGGTLLVLQGRQKYAEGTFGFDDRLPASLGTWSLNASAALNSVLGLGEQTYFSIELEPRDRPAATARAGRRHRPAARRRRLHRQSRIHQVAGAADPALRVAGHPRRFPAHGAAWDLSGDPHPRAESHCAGQHRMGR